MGMEKQHCCPWSALFVSLLVVKKKSMLQFATVNFGVIFYLKKKKKCKDRSSTTDFQVDWLNCSGDTAIFDIDFSFLKKKNLFSLPK